MSSFIHSSKHFLSAQNSLQDLIIFRDLFYIPYHVQKRFPDLDHEAKYREDKTRAIIGGMFDELLQLSIKTVTLQYAHHHEDPAAQIAILAEVLPADKKHRERAGQFLNLKPVELYKALKSIRYQIELDYITNERALTEAEDNAIFFINEMICTLAEYIITNSEEFRSAKTWSIEE